MNHRDTEVTEEGQNQDDPGRTNLDRIDAVLCVLSASVVR